MSRTAEMIEAVDNALLGTFQDLNVNGLRIRSDNGSQLTSSRYEKHLRTLGIKHETIHVPTPVEDGHIESYFDRFKEDYIYIREFVRFDDFREYMEWAVSDFNTKRPHSSLNYMTPDESEINGGKNLGVQDSSISMHNVFFVLPIMKSLCSSLLLIWIHSLQTVF